MPKVIERCEVCGVEKTRYRYSYDTPRHTFCSKKCYGKWSIEHQRGEGNHNWQGGKKRLVCEQCGKEYEAYVSDRAGKFCSLACAYENDGRNGAIREATNALWRDPGYRGMFLGENNGNWRGGTTPYLRAARNRVTDVARRAIERDGHICQKCGSDKNLHAHHILSFADFPQYRADLDNLITLCSDCHKQIHFGSTSGGAGLNNNEDFTHIGRGSRGPRLISFSMGEGG